LDREKKIRLLDIVVSICYKKINFKELR